LTSRRTFVAHTAISVKLLSLKNAFASLPLHLVAAIRNPVFRQFSYDLPVVNTIHAP
jgi:hypothetical protein